MNKIRTMVKKIFKTLIASVIIFVVGTFVALLIDILAHYCPVIFAIFAVVVLLVTGYLFGNEFIRK